MEILADVNVNAECSLGELIPGEGFSIGTSSMVCVTCGKQGTGWKPKASKNTQNNSVTETPNVNNPSSG